MKIVITDDEALARERLRALLDDLDNNIRVVGEAGTGGDTLRLCEQFQPHILLLDIAMPGMDGLEVARHLSATRCPPAVVFTTAYDQYALQAFDANAVSYLLKPIRREQLGRALERASTLSRAQLAALEHEETARTRTQLCARHNGDVEVVSVASILYFQADQKYVTAVHLGGRTLLDESLKSLETEFSERFVRIHRNALVCRSRIAGLVKDQGGHNRVRLQGTAEELEVSRRHAPQLRRLLHG